MSQISGFAMRKIFLSILLATTAAVATTPAVAQRTDREERAKDREDRQSKRTEAREERQSKSAKAAEEAKPAKPVAREERVQQRAVQQERVQAREDRTKVREERVQQRAIQQEPSPRPALKANRSAIIDRQEERRELIDQRRNSRATGVEQSAGVEKSAGAADAFTADREQYLQQRRQARAQLQQQRQELSRERLAERVKEGRRLPPPPGAAPDRPAPPPPVVETSKPAPSWSATHWRRDNRHDWRRWRDHNRSLFRLGYYFDPFGWGYHRYGIGWRLWPAYYNEYFWLNDPWEYRLPYAPWPYQWVRYYNDAILVNVFTGQVVDVEYNFFW